MDVRKKKDTWRCWIPVLMIPLSVSLCVWASCAWADSQFLPAQPLSMEQVIQTTLEQNPDIAMAQEKLGMARDALAQTRALFLPRVSLYSEARTGDSPSAYLFKTIDQREFLPGTDFNDPGNVENVESGLRFHMNLFRGGQDRAAMNLARSHLRETRAQTRQTGNLMVSSAIRLFFSILKARSYIDIAEQSVKNLEEKLRVMNVRFQGGSILRSDLLSIEVRLTEAKRDLIHARNIHEAALTGLNVLLGNDPETPLPLKEQCVCPFTLPATYQEAVKVALKNRPEMIMAEQMVEKAQWQLRKAKGEYLPSLDLEGAWYTDANQGKFDEKSNNYILGLSMNWNLYTGGTRRFGADCAEKSLALARKNMEKIQLSIYQEVKQAYLHQKDASYRLDVARKGVEMAKESFDIIARRYEGGSESVSRYLETELARNQSRIHQAAAFYDEKIALSDMALSLGILSQIWESGQKESDKTSEEGR